MGKPLIKVLLSIAVLMVIVVIGINILLYVYKDEIKERVDKQIAENVEADVYFDADKFALSIFKDFPDLSVTLGDFGIVCRGDFKGDTLMAIDEFNISLNLASVVFDDAIQIDGISLENPQIYIKVLEDGKANYDIAKTLEATDNSNDKNEVSAEDPSSSMKIEVHYWNISNANIIYDDMSLSFLMGLENLNHSGSGDFTLDQFDMKTQTTVEKLTVLYDGVNYINEKKLAADVTIGMNLPAMTFTFSENKVLLNDFGFSFDGDFKMPDNGYEMGIGFEGKDNTFKSILSLVPPVFLEGYEDLETKGKISFSGELDGVYDEENNLMPSFDMNLQISDAMFKYPDLPVAAKNINMILNMSLPEGDVKKSLIDLSKFQVDIAGNPLKATFNLRAMDVYDTSLDTEMDLGNITKLIHLDSMNLEGKITAHLKSKGIISDAEAGKYDKLKSSGELTVNALKFSSNDLPQGIRIKESVLSFNPEEIILEKYIGNLGRSDIQLDGKISNYIGFAFSGTPLVGNMTFNSSLFDINEWMETDEPEVPEENNDSDTSSTSLEVIPIPKNIDFTFDAGMSKIIYDNLEITELKGAIIVKDGIMNLTNAGFNLLGGEIKGSGAYNTFNPEEPKFDSDLKIKQLSFKKAYEAFNTIRVFAPIAKNINGTFDANVKIKGDIGQDMMPVYSTLNGKGDVLIKHAKMKDVGIVNLLANMSGLKELKDPPLKDLKAEFEIKDGKFHVKPFDWKAKGFKARIEGHTSLDGNIFYTLKSSLPPKFLKGEAAKKLPFDLGNSNVPLTFNITGTYDKPKLGIGPGKEDETLKEVAKNKMKDKAKEAKEEVKKEVKEGLKDLTKDLLKKDSTKSVKDKLEDKKNLLKNKFKFGKKKKNGN